MAIYLKQRFILRFMSSWHCAPKVLSEEQQTSALKNATAIGFQFDTDVVEANADCGHFQPHSSDPAETWRLDVNRTSVFSIDSREGMSTHVCPVYCPVMSSACGIKSNLVIIYAATLGFP